MELVKAHFHIFSLFHSHHSKQKQQKTNNKMNQHMQKLVECAVGWYFCSTSLSTVDNYIHLLHKGIIHRGSCLTSSC